MKNGRNATCRTREFYYCFTILIASCVSAFNVIAAVTEMSTDVP